MAGNIFFRLFKDLIKKFLVTSWFSSANIVWQSTCSNTESCFSQFHSSTLSDNIFRQLLAYIYM